MDVVWQARNLKLNEEVKKRIDRKLQGLGKKFQAIAKAEIEVTREHTRSRMDQVVTQVTLNGEGILLRSEERGPDVLTAVDSAMKSLDSRVRHLKGKLYRSEAAHRATRRSQALEDTRPPAEPPTEPEDLPEGVVRVKRFVMMAMPVQEAISQMELLGHTFFFFEDSASGNHAVVYKRRDGKYALIEPEEE